MKTTTHAGLLAFVLASGPSRRMKRCKSDIQREDSVPTDSQAAASVTEALEDLMSHTSVFLYA